jgi:hypothetical protein
MRTLAMKAVAAIGVVVLVSPVTAAHADGQYGDIKPGAVLRHVEHLSQNSTKGWAVSASADGHTVAVGGPVQNAHGDSFGHVDVWVQTTTGWALQADLSSPVSGRLADEYGLTLSLSADGQHLAVGDEVEPFYFREDDWYGVVYTYTRTATGWSAPTTIASPDQAFEGEFGSSVALNADGSQLIAGAKYDGILDGSPDGAAWAFTRTTAGWGEGQPLAPPTDQPRRVFGEHVAISADGRLAAVTDSVADVGQVSRAGSVITFARGSDGSWTQAAVLTDQPLVPGGEFGSSVAISADGSTIAVGAAGYYSVPSRVLVYRRAGTAWARSATFLNNSDDATHHSLFGYAVALSSTGDVVAVGAPYRARAVADAGGVYRYRWTGSSWSYLGATFVRGAVKNEQDGWSVALSGDAGRLFIGAPGYRRPGAHPSLTGAAYVVG